MCYSHGITWEKWIHGFFFHEVFRDQVLISICKTMWVLFSFRTSYLREKNKTCSDVQFLMKWVGFEVNWNLIIKFCSHGSIFSAHSFFFSTLKIWTIHSLLESVRDLTSLIKSDHSFCFLLSPFYMMSSEICLKRMKHKLLLWARFGPRF